ncbi:ATP-binding protein [bacterium]|nr:ATP-binding protein [candidate division CSSED10-310 bacterium]
MHRRLQQILLADNPWLSDRTGIDKWLSKRLPQHFIPRQQTLGSSRRWSETNRAHIVIGPRQSGKSTAIWAYLRNAGKPALFIDCEQFLIRDWCSSASLFLEDLPRLLPEPAILFFEEIQHLKDAGLFLKGLIDRHVGVPVLVTGSSSFHLQAQTRESLAGRATRTRLLPFSFQEICQDIVKDLPDIPKHSLIDARFQRHLIYGGYPEVWQSSCPEALLSDLVEAVVLRDLSDQRRIERPDAFRRLLQLIAGQVGSLVNLSEWSAILGINRDTVASYLEILASSHIIATIRPFAGGKRSEITAQPKVYFIDQGIRNNLLLNYQPFEERLDKGALLENWVFTELWKALPIGASLHHWRSTSKAEVDFVLAYGQQLTGIEVKAKCYRQLRLSRASRSFIDAYEPEFFFVVNQGIHSEIEIAGTRVLWVKPDELPMVLPFPSNCYNNDYVT